MYRVFSGLIVAASALVLAAGTAAANDANTIRIEPRPFYGATVSLESGVRVFRPLPPTTTVIVNPNKTPLKVSVKNVTRHVYYSGQGTSEGFASADRDGFGLAGYNPYITRFGRGHKRGHGKHIRRKNSFLGGGHRRGHK